MPARRHVHSCPRPDVRDPREREDQPGIHYATTRQKCAERYGHVGGNGRNDVFDGGEHSDQRVERRGGELLEKGDEVCQEALPGSCNVATAITATPSPRPIQPMPSFVFALTET